MGILDTHSKVCLSNLLFESLSDYLEVMSRRILKTLLSDAEMENVDRGVIASHIKSPEALLSQKMIC